MPAPAIVWPDIEAAFITYMKAALTARPEPYASGVTVTNKMPATRPARVVLVRDDGGPALGDVRATARLGIQVWAATAADTADLAALVTALVMAWPNGNTTVLRASATRAFPIADESGNTYRYLTADLTIRGVGLS
jgi:hypothetical protein